MDRADILPQHTDKEELDGANEEHPDDQWGDAQLELIPEEQLGDEVAEAEEEADQGHAKADKGGEPQRRLGVVGEPEHRQIPEGEEVVLGEATAAGRLLEGDQGPRVAKVTDHPPQVGVGVLDLPDLFDHLAVIDPEAGHMLDQFDLRGSRDEGVVGRSDPVEELRFAAARLLGEDDGKPRLPLFDQLGDQRGGVLKIGGHGDDGLPTGLQHAVIDRADVPKIPIVDDDLEPLVEPRQLFESRHGAILRGVVDEDDFKIVAGEISFDDHHQVPVEISDILLLVVTSSDDAQQWPSTHGELSRCTVVEDHDPQTRS